MDDVDKVLSCHLIRGHPDAGVVGELSAALQYDLWNTIDLIIDEAH